MKSILVGEHRGRKLYYLPESKSLTEDGALLNASGQIKIINFWKFTRTKEPFIRNGKNKILRSQ